MDPTGMSAGLMQDGQGNETGQDLDMQMSDDNEGGERSLSNTRAPQSAVTQTPQTMPKQTSKDVAPNDVGPSDESNVTDLPSADSREQLRIVEALLFAAAEPLDVKDLAEHLSAKDDVGALLNDLQGAYAGRGINLIQVAGKWQFRTAEDLSFLLERHAKEERRLSKAALETLSIIAYHQPVTRAEIEEIRGVQTSSGTLDVLMEMKWVRPRGRRRAPGRPITYGTTAEFLEHFSLDRIKDLPGLSELKGAGLLDSALPPDFNVPEPRDVAALMPDELPLEEEPEEETAELPFGAEDPDDVAREEAEEEARSGAAGAGAAGAGAAGAAAPGAEGARGRPGATSPEDGSS